MRIQRCCSCNAGELQALLHQDEEGRPWCYRCAVKEVSRLGKVAANWYAHVGDLTAQRDEARRHRGCLLNDAMCVIGAWKPWDYVKATTEAMGSLQRTVRRIRKEIGGE